LTVVFVDVLEIFPV